jgi:long-chain acyl-CoA synthetase
MTTNNTQTLWRAMTAAPAADYLVQPEGRFSFGDLAQAVRQWLAAFDAHGIMPGDRVVIRTGNEQAATSGFLAAILDGVVPVLLSADTPPRRVHAICETVRASLFVADDQFEMAPAWPATIRLSAAAPRRFGFGKSVGKLPGLAFPPAARAPKLPLDAAGLAYILFTSGTTSAPSGVCISRGNMFANLATLTRIFGYDARSRIFNDMILAHADGLVQGLLLAAFNGCALIRSGGFQLGSIEAWLNRVRTTRATHVITVPTIWAMIDSYAAHDDYFDAPECVALSSVAAKLPEPLWQRLETRFGKPMFNQYGLTETVTSAVYAGPHPEMGAFGTIGKPIDCEARIDPAMTGVGELQLRGDQIFSGYWQDPARTAASFVDGGWLKTGDLAQMQDDGSFQILGRLKTVIMSGGFLIRPDEIDEAMLLHPSVQESVTVALPDAMFDEVPVTAIVTRSAIAENALTDHARLHLEKRKVPKRIIIMDAIPRGDAGKPQLGALRERLAQAMASHTAGRSTDATQEAVLAAAADVFRVAPALLSLRTAQGDVPGWDSFSQISLVLAVEQALGIRIPASRVAVTRTLGDLVRIVEDLRK